MIKTKKNNEIVELSLISQLNYLGISDLLKGLFIQIGIKPENIVESHDKSISKVSTYLKSADRAQYFKKRFLKLKLKEVCVRFKTLKPRDWKDRWKEEFRPFALTPSIDVVPFSFKKRYKPNKRMLIYIETANAFGSGLHETTQFTARLIEKCRGRFKGFLDIGTGTGILSLVALKNQAAYVDAIDVDRICTQSAKKNFENNKCSFRKLLVCDVQKVKNLEKYDLVAANLITHDLIRLRKKIVSLVKPGGYLVLSGIMMENLDSLKQAYRNSPLRCLKIQTGYQWVGLLYKKGKR